MLSSVSVLLFTLNVVVPLVILDHPGGSEQRQRPDRWHRNEPGQQEEGPGDREVCSTCRGQSWRSVHHPHPAEPQHPSGQPYCYFHRPKAPQAPRPGRWAQDGRASCPRGRRRRRLVQGSSSSASGVLLWDGCTQTHHGRAKEHLEGQSSGQHPEEGWWKAREPVHLPTGRQLQRKWKARKAWETREAGGWWEGRQDVQHLQTSIWRF